MSENVNSIGFNPGLFAVRDSAPDRGVSNGPLIFKHTSSGALNLFPIFFLKNKARHGLWSYSSLSEKADAAWNKPAYKFSDQKFYLENQSQLDERYDRIVKLISSGHSLKDLEDAILLYSDLRRMVDDNESWSKIHVFQDSSNKEYSNRDSFISGEIMPYVLKKETEIYKLFKNSPHYDLLPEPYRSFKIDVKIKLRTLSDEYIQLKKQEDELLAQYRRVVSGLKITYEGGTYTTKKAMPFLESPDRQVRESVWNLINDEFFKIKDTLNDIFNKLISVRNQMAISAGYNNYLEYKADETGINPEWKHQINIGLVEQLVPLFKNDNKAYANDMGLESLRPWDGTVAAPVSLLGEKVLKPYTDEADYLAKGIQVLRKLRDEFGDLAYKMVQSGHLDYKASPGKNSAINNFEQDLSDEPGAFIFINLRGSHADVKSIMHEMGHAVQANVIDSEPLIWNAKTNKAVGETVSMGMELLTMPYWGAYYDNPEDLCRAQKIQLNKSLYEILWKVVLNEFEAWVYTHVEATVGQRDEHFVNLMKEYGFGDTDWSDLEAYQQLQWQQQSLIFFAPMYYDNYIIGQAGALELYKNARQNPERTINQLIPGAALGNSRPVPEILKALGATLDFSPKKNSNLIKFIQNDLKNLNQGRPIFYSHHF